MKTKIKIGQERLKELLSQSEHQSMLDIAILGPDQLEEDMRLLKQFKASVEN